MKWHHIQKLNGGSWWQREGTFRWPVYWPADWTIIETRAAPFWW